MFQKNWVKFYIPLTFRIKFPHSGLEPVEWLALPVGCLGPRVPWPTREHGMQYKQGALKGWYSFICQNKKNMRKGKNKKDQIIILDKIKNRKIREPPFCRKKTGRKGIRSSGKQREIAENSKTPPTTGKNLCSGKQREIAENSGKQHRWCLATTKHL